MRDGAKGPVQTALAVNSPNPVMIIPSEPVCERASDTARRLIDQHAGQQLNT